MKAFICASGTWSKPPVGRLSLFGAKAAALAASGRCIDMMRVAIFGVALAACGGSLLGSCPPGDEIADWQVITDWNSQYSAPCETQIKADVAAHGSVWISLPEHRHDPGIATLTASVQGDCQTVKMSVGITPETVVPTNGKYSSSGSVKDPWVVAMGVMSDTACTATIDHVAVSIQVQP